jgi:hypothetical protein
MTLAQLIAAKRAAIAALMTERRKNVDELAELRSKAELTEADEARVEELRAANADIDQQRGDLESKVAEYEAERAADEAADAAARAVTETVASPNERRAPAVVTSEERTYHEGNDPRGEMFLRDVAAAFLGNHQARERTERHMSEEIVERGAGFEQRAASTGSFAGLVVPQYLTDLVAPAAAQASENAAVSSTDIDDTLLTETMFTVAGQQVMSRQSIERGVGTEEITLNDLVRRYHSALDSKLLNDATTGLTNVAQSVAYTDASPTAAELYPKLLNAQANLEAVMLDQGVGDVYAVMHSRRWAWLQSQVGTSWPFISQPGIPVQAGGVATSSGYAQGVRGVLPNGVKVIVDNNIATNLGAGTNEDEIYVVNASELHLWEDSSAPLFIRAEQTNAASLGVLMVVYGYAAYSFRRYTNGHQKIAGTGLVTPTF